VKNPPFVSMCGPFSQETHGFSNGKIPHLSAQVAAVSWTVGSSWDPAGSQKGSVFFPMNHGDSTYFSTWIPSGKLTKSY